MATNRKWISEVRCTRLTVSFVLLLLVAGLPSKSRSSSADPDSKQASAKECRVHIEKALDQYFDSSEQGDHRTTRETQIQQPQDDDDDNDDEDDAINEDQEKDDPATNDDDDNDDDDDENDDDEEENEINRTNTLNKNKNGNDDNDDDDDDEDEDEDDDENEDEDEDDDNIKKETERDSNLSEVVESDDDDDDEDEDENEKDDDDDDDDDEEEEEGEDKKLSASNQVKELLRSEEKKDNASKKDDNVKDNYDDDDDDEEDDDDDEEEEEEDDDTPVHQTRILPIQKATGGPDSTTTRVVSKLPPVVPKTEQPQAQTIPKEQETLAKKQVDEPPKSKPTTPQPVEDDEDDDDTIENIYEDDDDDDSTGTKFRSRSHIDAILGLDDIGTNYDQDEDKLAQSIFREIKKIHATSIKPMELMYKYTDSTSRLLGDAEIFGKPMILFLGPWSTGKSTIINYLLGTERTPAALKTGTGFAGVDFSVITYGDERQTISGTELAADWRYASLQKFGQGFLDHFKAVTLPHTLLKKINLIDTPGILENRKNTERGYSFNDAFQWFVDRADAIYVVLDPTKVDIGTELGAVIDQLKGREVRFILNKADTIRRSELMRVVGQLFWNLSPLMSSTEAPVIYAVSLSSKPFNPSAPAKFLADQENNFLYDLKETLNKRVENRILYARRHAVRVRNHAKMVDCYLATYYRHKSIFSSKRNVAKLITENPVEYHIYEGISSMSNVSRYDLPDASTYKSFFRQYPLYDFKALASTCSYFRGCPMDKLDNAIAKELPELFTKYKKAKVETPQTSKKVER